MNKENPLFSIITPCYNAEKYLKNSVESILRQPFDNWELLLIDDGSADSTPAICDQYAESDPRIKVIHQQNGGVSAARNRGLDTATGEWILFIDSDDWFTDGAFDIYTQSIKKYTADRFIFNRYNYKSGTTVKTDLQPDVLIRDKDSMKYFLLDMLFPYYDTVKNKVVTGGIRGVNCSLYRRQLIEAHHIRFEAGIKIAEDAMFNYDIISHAEHVCMQNLMVGYYRIEDSSVMHKYNPHIDDINLHTIRGFRKRIDRLMKDDEEYRIAYLGLIAECVFRGMKLKYVNQENNTTRKERIQQFKDWFYQDEIQKGLDYSLLKFLPRGKKQIIWCLKHKMVGTAMRISSLSMAYLKKKNKI